MGEEEMKHFLGPYRSFGVALLLAAGAGLAMAPPGARAQSSELVQLMGQEPSPLLGHSSISQGYLGVDLADLDQEKAQTLKLKDVHGAVITLIDHDAPAGQIGLKVNDVVLQLNGQTVEGAEQLRRMLREIPAGRKVSMQISRDGNMQTVTVELADRRVMEHEVWDRIGNGGDVFAQGTGKGILTGGGDEGLPGGFHMPFFGSTLNVGAMVEPLTSQMAEYLGVASGVMVKQVAHKSEAATAGLKAFDVILKVGPEAVTTLADWDRALRANQGKPVQVTVLRDKKQQTLTLQVDSKRKQGELDLQDLFGEGNCPLVAGLDSDLGQQFSWNNEAAAQAMRDQAEKLKEQLKSGQLGLTQQQAEELRKQAEKLRESMKAGEFKLDQKQMDELKQQMEEWRKNFNPEDFKDFNFEDFKVDPKQMDELKRQMDEFRKNFKPEDFKDFKFDQKQMDEMKRQMEEMKTLGLGSSV
jgi:membrane-associated protease RseP (regulator of RpoE activity)